MRSKYKEDVASDVPMPEESSPKYPDGQNELQDNVEGENTDVLRKSEIEKLFRNDIGIASDRELGLSEPGDAANSDNGTSLEKGDAEIYKMSKSQAMSSLIILSSSFMVMFSAVNTFSNVQSTLNKEKALGTIGLTVLYTSAVVTNIFVPLTLSNFRSKTIMTVSMVTYVGYLASGFYSSWFTVVPGAVLIGAGATHLWVASQAYITDLVKYSETSVRESISETTTLFFGVFFAIFYSSQVWGNLYSSLVFRDTGGSNLTLQTRDVPFCGSRYCPRDTTNNTNLNPPSREKIDTYTSICIGCAGVAILGMLFVRNLPFIPRRRLSICGRLSQVFKHMFVSKTQRYLIPVTLYRGISRVFAVGDYTVAFVSCTMGVGSVGFVMIAYGVVTTVVSFVAGRLCKYTGELPLFTAGFTVQMSLCVTMLLWEPSGQQAYPIYLIAALWGLGDAVYGPTVTALYSLFFTKHRDEGFASFRFLDSLGLAIAFAYSGFLCTTTKIYIVIGFIVISLSSLIVLLRKRNKHFQ